MSLALSTSWNAYRFNDGAKLLFEIEKLGFKKIELSFNLSSNLVEGIAKESRRLGMSIQSLHNYCPIPEGLTPKQALPDCYSLAVLDEQERALAVKYTKRSIDTAARLGAQAVVLHCGRVGITDSTRHLISLYNQGLKANHLFTKLKAEMFRERNLNFKKFLDQVIISLDELNKYAQENRILLGIETRFYHSEIPDIHEIGIILEQFKNSQIHYWHDSGHAQLMENLGFAKHQDFLDLYGDRLIGIHLHDISGCQDHLAPISQNIDFRMFKPYLNENTLKVIEAHQPATAEQIIKSREFLSEIYDGAN